MTCFFCITGYNMPRGERPYTQMKNLIIALIAVFIASTGYAQNKKSLVDIDKELKQAKSTATAMALIESIAETTPQTEADVAALGQLMDKYPSQGQKALAKIKDPQLAKAIMKECDREVVKVKGDKGSDWRNLPEPQRQEKINALLNSHAMIGALGNLKNKDAVPYLKQFITPEYDGTLSYTASQAIGRIAPDDPVVFKELWDKQGVKSISYSAYGKSVLKEVAQKMQDPTVSEEEKRKILWKAKPALFNGKDPAEKRLIKDILLNHPSRELKIEVGVAMVHAVINNYEESDKDFVVQWAKKEKSLAVWDAPHVMDKIWDKRFVPVLLEMMQSKEDWMPKGNIAEILGRHKVKEAVPYLEEALEDKDSSVRSSALMGLRNILGKNYLPKQTRHMDADVQEHIIKVPPRKK